MAHARPVFWLELGCWLGWGLLLARSPQAQTVTRKSTQQHDWAPARDQADGQSRHPFRLGPGGPTGGWVEGRDWRRPRPGRSLQALVEEVLAEESAVFPHLRCLAATVGRSLVCPALLLRKLDGATAGLWPRSGWGSLTLAQEPPGAGTGRQGPGEVYFQRGGGRPPARRSVPGARVEPRRCFGAEGDPDPHIPRHLAALGPRPTHPDSCPGAPSAGPPSPPLAPLSPKWLDTECQVPTGEGEDSVSLGVLQDAGLLDHEPLLGAAASASAVAPPLEDVPEADSGEDECPICTEPYGPGEHRLELLNCGHGLCAGCLHQLLGATRSTDLGRVRCPLCRQKTPMLEWEICRLQEELLQADGPQPPPPATPPVLPRRGPGPWAALEHRYQLRFLAGPMGVQGCLPFLPCPPCLGAWLWALRERGPCARRLALLSLLSLELLGLLLIFMPLMLLGLLVVFLDRAGR
ncbi:ring finger protein-like [Trichechus inunguis]